ncbi:MAG TPA: hypothetical protein VIG03_05495 [Steroidobacteraceae bacterium]|jgi:hypothetical protein
MQPTGIEDGLEAPEPMTPAERRLAESRAEIEGFLAGGPDTFPRSQTMRFVMGGRGKMVVFGVFAGLLAVKPRLAMSLVRFLPLGKLVPVARILQSMR